MSEPESSFPMGGGLGGHGGGAPGGLPEDMLFARLQHLEQFLASFQSHLIDANIAGEAKRFQILAIEKEGGADNDVYFQWKVTRRLDENGVVVEDSYDLAEGSYWDNGTEHVVPGQNLVGSGYVVLTSIRDVSSRAVLTVTPSIMASVPDSDYSNQYRVIAYVSPLGIIQYQFEEIRILEDLIAVSGEFKLGGLELSYRNTYDVPV